MKLSERNKHHRASPPTMTAPLYSRTIDRAIAFMTNCLCRRDRLRARARAFSLAFVPHLNPVSFYFLIFVPVSLVCVCIMFILVRVYLCVM